MTLQSFTSTLALMTSNKDSAFNSQVEAVITQAVQKVPTKQSEDPTENRDLILKAIGDIAQSNDTAATAAKCMYGLLHHTKHLDPHCNKAKGASYDRYAMPGSRSPNDTKYKEEADNQEKLWRYFRSCIDEVKGQTHTGGSSSAVKYDLK